MSQAIPQSRREAIHDRLANGARVAVADLVAEFGVSNDAIRRDLRALAAAGVCRRVYGGALPVSPAGGPISERRGRDHECKRALAAAAVTQIAPGECVFLDAGSTNLVLAALLPRALDVTIVSNSAAIVAALAERTDIRLISIGGVLDSRLGACVGPDALEQLGTLRIDRLFLGACAVSVAAGVRVFDPMDRAFKRRLLTCAQHTTVLVTHDKLETSAPFELAPLSAIDTVVVEADADPALRARLAAAGPEIVIADDA